MSEWSDKETIIRGFMAEQQIGALLLRRVSSFAWATNGSASYVSTATDYGEAALLITPDARYVITNNIEAPRLRNEEKLEEQGWQFATRDWWTGDDPMSQLTDGLTLGADYPHPGAKDVSAELARIRADLTPEEGARFSELGRLCGEAFDAIVPRIRPGMTEYQLCALLAEETMSRGVYPIVQQAACDQRAFAVRHAIPTGNQLENYAVIALCGRKYGLVASISRSIHLGPVPQELAAKHEAVAKIDAALILASRPGAVLSQVFAEAQKAYAEAGYANEWHDHHQGGTAGYEPREYLGSPTAAETVKEGQAYAWNPSISGTKSEDTVLIAAEGNRVLTATAAWPILTCEVNGQTVERAGILEI